MLATKNATKTGALALFCVPRHVFGAVRSWGTRFRELFFATVAGTTMKRGFPNPPPNPPHLEIAGRRRRLKLGEKPNRFDNAENCFPFAVASRVAVVRAPVWSHMGVCKRPVVIFYKKNNNLRRQI